MHKSEEYLVEAAKQIISLASASIVLVITFKEKFLIHNAIPSGFRVCLIFSLLAVGFALLGILTVAGVKNKSASGDVDIYALSIRLLFIGAILSYFISVSLFIVFGLAIL